METGPGKNVLAVVGSAGEDSANERLLRFLALEYRGQLNIEIFNRLKSLPHFDPGLSAKDPPQEVIDFRNGVERADAVLICTPEYVFSIPAGLKNALEWCVATTVFSGKPMGLITASAQGRKGHEELQLIVRTLMGDFTEATTLLIAGIKSKVDAQGTITDPATEAQLRRFMITFMELVSVSGAGEQ